MAKRDKNLDSSHEKANLISQISSHQDSSSVNDDTSTIESSKNKNFYNDLQNMNNYLKDTYSKFFENFELTKYINSGSKGKVFEGILKNPNNNRKKLAFKFKISQDNKKKDDSQEISILRKLNHKNITEIYAYVKMPDKSNFCVLELAKYGDIEYFQKILLKRKILSETLICYLTKQILEGLQYIHKCKIIHMDLKEGNILIDSNLNVKITDFSVSCSYLSFNPKDIIVLPFAGTSKYMSPEILNRTKIKIKECCKIDLYSLGVTLYNLAFGFYPYRLNEVGKKEYDNVLKNIRNKNLEFPEIPRVSNLFKDFLKGLLEKDYKKRFNIKQAMNHSWAKGADILFDEKEDAFCHENFLINLVTDNMPKFNEYILEKNKKQF